MPRFALTLEWDGSPYMGFQRQPHGPTVQQAVEAAVRAVTGEEVSLHAAGRTDTGVHARAMVAHFDLSRDFNPFRLSEGINAKLTGMRVFRVLAAHMNTASSTAARR